MSDFEKFNAAFSASGLTKQEAREIIGLNSYEAFQSRLNEPDSFRLRELKLLKDKMGETSSRLLIDAVNYFFCN